MKISGWSLHVACFLLAFSSLAAAKTDKALTLRFGVAAVGTGNRPVFGGANAATVHIKGLLEEEFKADGIKVEWSYFKGAGPAVNEAIANDLLDFAWQGDLPSIIGKSTGLKTKLIIPDGTRGQTYLAVPLDSKAQSIADLKGKKVSLFRGTNLQLTVARILDSQGLAEKDFKIINMDGATGRAALTTKDIDGLWGGYELLQLQQQGLARIIYSTQGQPAELTRTTHILVTEAFESKYPELVQRVVNVFVQEAAWTSDPKNREQVLEQWTKSGIPYAVWKQDYQAFPLAVRLSPLFDAHITNHYRQALDAALKFKLVRTRFDIDSWLEEKYVNRAIQDLNLKDAWQAFDAQGRS